MHWHRGIGHTRVSRKNDKGLKATIHLRSGGSDTIYLIYVATARLLIQKCVENRNQVHLEEYL